MRKTVETLDLTGIACPMNSARAVLKLAQMPRNSCLEIILDDGQPVENVPLALMDEGYRIIAKNKRENQWILRVEK